MARPCVRVAMMLFLVLGLSPPLAEAGMGNPFPMVYESAYKVVQGLNETPLARLRAISFFVAVLLISSWGVQKLWNSLLVEFPKLPRLSFGKAAGGVTLWGLLFIIVLTMISGARELMTPGAWKRNGFTYQLNQPKVDHVPDELRRDGLERLRVGLMQYAAKHGGKYPATADEAGIAPEFWTLPHRADKEYGYVGGLTLDDTYEMLAYEPETTGVGRFVLFASGRIAILDEFGQKTAFREQQP